MLNSYAENIGGIVHRVPVDEALRLDLEAMGKKVNENTKLIYVCNPNNPTGTIVPVTKADAGESSHNVAPSKSSGWPKRFIGVWSMICWPM